MAKVLNPYPFQVAAIKGVKAHWRRGSKSVCLVCPTGGGKTLMGAVLVGESRTLWVAHREELVRQAATRLAGQFGASNVGYVMAGKTANPGARIQVGTIQTLLNCAELPDAELLVLDECHHYRADKWQELLGRYPGARVLGLTATPERQDGKPLGDIFKRLVVAAQTQELIKKHYLVPANTFTPIRPHGKDLAQYPVDAWIMHAGNGRGFVFCKRVESEGTETGAYAVAQRFQSGGISAAVIEAKTKKADRARILKRFESGDLRVLVNVGVLTEGVDMPAANVAMFVRQFKHVGGMIQAAGRVLRKAPGKKVATIIDLSGSVLMHGAPTSDREYSLTGRAISRMPKKRAPAPRERGEAEQEISGERLVLLEDQFIQGKKAQEKARDAVRRATPEAKAKAAARDASPEYKTRAAAYQASPERKVKLAARRASPKYQAKQAAYRASPEGKAKLAARQAAPEAKAKKAAYRASPEYKAQKAAYKASPEYKAKVAAYNASPEGKAKVAAYKASPKGTANRAAYQAARAKRGGSVDDN